MKEKQKVLFEDYLFLWRVVSLQHALVVSSTDPVVIGRLAEGADFQGPPEMYYDCCEDEERALTTMGERIRLAEEGIREHFKLHKKCLNYFLEMDGAIVTDDREDFTSSCTKVCENVFKYLDIVREHQQRLQENSFLFYPYCVPGHYFHILNHNRVAPCSFNKEHSYEGATEDLNKILDKILDFRIRQDELPYISLPFHEQEGVGLLDTQIQQISHVLIEFL